MELHGGTLSIDSTVGQGTVVFLRLPLDRLVDFEGPATAEPETSRPTLLH